MIVPSGSAVTADLRWRAFGHGHGYHAGAERLKMRRQLRDAFGIRAPADADPDGPVVLQHVAAVECARRFDRSDAISLSAHRVFGRADFAPPLGGSRTADDCEVAVDDHGVFDEHRVGTLRCGDHLVCGPARDSEGDDVSVPLTLGEFGIHMFASTMWVTSPSASRGDGRRTRAWRVNITPSCADRAAACRGRPRARRSNRGRYR